MVRTTGTLVRGGPDRASPPWRAGPLFCVAESGVSGWLGLPKVARADKWHRATYWARVTRGASVESER